jgi:hypothetical protein
VKKLFVPVFVLLVSAGRLTAQQGTTSELTGRVSVAGQALPAVRVILDSDALQGSRVAITGDNGGYVFPNVPPAEYRVQFELQGFATLQTQTRVSLAGTARLDAELQPAPMQETITVQSTRAEAPVGASIATNFRANDLKRLPGVRDIKGTALLSSSVSAQGPRGTLVIAGAPSWDSLFLVDGAVVSEYLSGQPQNVVLEDAIDEVVLLTGAISAEFGRFTGGVVSTLTKSGGNELSGSLRDAVSSAPYVNSNHALEGTLGGYLRKDRLWFFVAARDAANSSGLFTTMTNIPYESSFDERRGEAKLTAQITSGSSLAGSYLGTVSDETNATDLRGLGRSLDLTSLIRDRTQSLQLLSLTSNNTLGRDTFAEIHYAAKNYAIRGNGGQSPDRIAGTLIQSRAVAGNMNAPLGCGICADDRRESRAWSLKTSHYRNTRWGNHNLVAGAEGFHEERSNEATRSSSDFNIQATNVRFSEDGSTVYPQFDAGTTIAWTRHITDDLGSDLNTTSGFVNDRWDVNSRLNLNAGLRYDRNDARDATGRVISQDSAYSPRLSATFDLRGDGRHRIVGSYGQYASRILEGGGAPQQIGVFDTYAWRYRGPPINTATTPANELLTAPAALAQLWAWFDQVGGTSNRQYLTTIAGPTASGDFQGSLKSPAMAEWSLGYLMQGSSGFLRADYINRDWRDFYAVRVDTSTGHRQDPLGNTLDVAWIVNDSQTVRIYRALQLQGSWNHKDLSVGGGYTFSSLRGNDDAEEGSMTGPRVNPLRLWYPEFFGYAHREPVGPLKQDQPHRARLWVTDQRKLPRGSLYISLLQSFDSGTPYSAAADIDPTGRVTPYDHIPANPGYVFSNGSASGSYFFSSRGAFRTDNVFSTDLALTYDLPYSKFTFFVKGETLNVFNNSAVVAVDTGVTTRFRGGADLLAFNPFTDVPVQGVNYRLSSTFGKPTGPDSYQTPRTYRFSVGARF